MMQIPDPIHGYIELDGMFAHIVNTPEFQRLRSVEQGSFRPAYPGARHDRFAHSLGTYHLAKKFAEPFFRNLANDLGVVLPAEEQALLTRTFLYAALLHDIGHAPFSHTTEGFFEEMRGANNLPVIWHDLCTVVGQVNKEEGKLFSARNKKCGAPHEIMSATILVEKWQNFHVKPKNKPFEPEVDLPLAARMVIGFTYSPGDLSDLKDQNVISLGVRNCLIQMINYSLLDVDRLDYMGRDALMSGFVNARLDLDCLAQSATAAGLPDAWVLWKDERPPRLKDHAVRRVWQDVGATLLKDQELTLPKGTMLEGAAPLEAAGTYLLPEDVTDLVLKEGTYVALMEADSVALCRKLKTKLPKGTKVKARDQQDCIQVFAREQEVTLSVGTCVLPDAWVLRKHEARPRLDGDPILKVVERVGAVLLKDQLIRLPAKTVLLDGRGDTVELKRDSMFYIRQEVSGLELKKDNEISLNQTGGVVLRKEICVVLPKGALMEPAAEPGSVWKLKRAWKAILPDGTRMCPDDVVDVKLVKDETELMADGSKQIFSSKNRLQLRPSWLAPGYRDAALRVFDLMFQAKLSHDAWVLAAPAGAYDAALLAHCIRQLNKKIDPKYMETIFTGKALSEKGLVFAKKHYRLLSDVDIAADLKAQTGEPFEELHTRELSKRRIAAWRSYYEYHHIFNCPEMGLTPEKVYEFFDPLMKHLDEQKIFVFDDAAYKAVVSSNDVGAIRAAELLREFLRGAHTKKEIDEKYNVVLLDRTSNFTMKLDPADIRIVFSDHTRESKHLPLRSGRYSYSTYGDMTGITGADKRSKPYFYIMRHHGLGRDQLEKLRELLAKELKK